VSDRVLPVTLCLLPQVLQNRSHSAQTVRSDRGAQRPAGAPRVAGGEPRGEGRL
jgi:hypothetical protein